MADDVKICYVDDHLTKFYDLIGCGKSSRVPCFLLRADPPQPTLAAPECKMIVSQPRRIAAKALADRVRSCEPDLKEKIAMRSKLLILRLIS